MALSHSPKAFEKARQFIVRRVRSNPDLVEIVDHAFDFALSHCFSCGVEKSVWIKKEPNLMAVCENCNYQWVAGFSDTPEIARHALLARMAVCIRCLEGERVRFFEISAIRSSTTQGLEKTTVPVFKHKSVNSDRSYRTDTEDSQAHWKRTRRAPSL